MDDERVPLMVSLANHDLTRLLDEPQNDSRHTADDRNTHQDDAQRCVRVRGRQQLGNQRQRRGSERRLQSTPRLEPAHHARLHDLLLWWND
jgi:hypothetical protein